jgi:hypothetical protein
VKSRTVYDSDNFYMANPIFLYTGFQFFYVCIFIWVTSGSFVPHIDRQQLFLKLYSHHIDENETLLDNVSNSTFKNIFENGTIPKLIQKTGPPQCEIYTLGQLSTLYVLIRLEETNKNRSCDSSRRCMTCKHIQCTHKFSSTYTGEEFSIYCKTENIIYLLECAICDLQYIGETKQQLSKRLKT